MRRAFARFGCVLVVLVSIPFTADGAAGPASRLPIYCPAVEAEDRPRTNALGENTRQPTLVVLGKVRRAGPEEERTVHQKTEIEVEKVLLGSAPGRSFRCLSGWSYRPGPKPERLIVALVPLLESKEHAFEIRYTLGPEEEKAALALSAARMEYNALGADRIFVGKEVLADADRGRIIEVVRVLHGPASLKGKKVCVDLLEHPLRRGFTVPPQPLPTKGEHLYFVRAIDHEYKKRGDFRSIRNPEGPVYLVSYRLPGDQEKHVVAALKLRDECPVVEVVSDGAKVRCQEVPFRGSVAEAVELLGSASDGAVVLAGRFLRHRSKEARGPVLAAISKDLLLRQSDAPGGFRRLHNLIAVLPGLLPDETRQRTLERLVDRWLWHLSRNPAEPPAIKREPWEAWDQDEESQTDVNHSLAWLIGQLDEKQVVRGQGKRLLALRDTLPKRWKQEVQLALDVAQVEDHLELDVAWAKMKDVRPVRSRPPALRHPGSRSEGVIAFSPDGKYLATTGRGLRVWRTKDWSLAGPAIPLEGSISRLVFSPEGKYLYVAGGGGGLQIHARYDWKAGKLDRAYTGHNSGLADLALSADGKTMVTSNYYEDIIHVWDTATGKIRRSFKTPHLADEFALSPDGRAVYRRVAVDKVEEGRPKTRWKMEALEDGAREAPIEVLKAGLSLVAFSPDGRHFLTVEAGRYGGVTVVRLYDIKKGYRQVAEGKVDALPAKRVTFYLGPNVLLLEGGEGEGDVHAFTLPGLNPLKGFEKVMQRVGKLKSACLSPDGKLLAVGVFLRPTPYLFRTDTFEDVLPFEGHAESTVEVFFPAGGKVVRTLGSDNTVCTWDARTLKMLRRQHLPAGWKNGSSRQPDGRYLIGATEVEENNLTVRVFDAEAERLVAAVKVPQEAIRYLAVHWLNDREVFVLAGDELCQFDVPTGKVLARRKLAKELARGLAPIGSLTETGKDFFAINGGIPNRHPRVWIERVDAQSGKRQRVGKLELSRPTGRTSGLVPGGKLFYIGDPGLYLFDRKTLRPVVSLPFRGTDALSLHFTADGSRFCVVTGGLIHVDRNLRRWDPGTQSVVRIHDTQTGRTLGAFPASTRWVSVKFSPDGKQLAVINDDGTFELWGLSVLDRR
jgi:WD40 repeat protein